MRTDQERLLIVDDEKLNLNLLAELLKFDYKVMLAKNGEQALKRAETQNPDLILLDIMMSDMDGYEVIKQLKAVDATKDIPVIFISALSDAQDEEKGLLLGAVDYIAKPFNPAIVKARVCNHIKIVRQKKLLETIALLDGLTEIPNRRSYMERFKTEWKRAVRENALLSVGILDVDCFKQYNDHYGHAKGDDTLKSVAGVLINKLKRPADFGARYGGEEFVVILPGTDEDGALNLVDNMRISVEALNIPHEKSTVKDVLTISGGGITVKPRRNEDGDGIINMADDLLYKAKKEGKNRVYWEKMNLS